MWQIFYHLKAGHQTSTSPEESPRDEAIACSSGSLLGSGPMSTAQMNLHQREHGDQSSPSDVSSLGSTGFSQMAHREHRLHSFLESDEKTHTNLRGKAPVGEHKDSTLS